jgi:hypothetical protein
MRCLIPLALACAACSGGDAPPDADEVQACLSSGSGDTYAVGLERAGKHGVLDFRLMSATPAPPGRDFNSWVIQINELSAGAPVSNAMLQVAPFMPDHQHGPGAYQPIVQPMPEAGQYEIDQINTWMPGFWQITIQADTDTLHDSVVYQFCIQA